MSYKYYNPNPSDLFVGDCVIRALTKLLNLSWEEAYLQLMVQGFMMADMPSANRVWNELLLNKGYRRNFLPNNCPNCYTVKQFCYDNPNGDFLVATGEHVVAVVDGDYYDSWDSGNEILMYYYERK